MKFQYNNKPVTVNTSPNWASLLGIIFILCKIFEIAPILYWSWWLVLLPFYFGFVVLGVFLLGGAIFAGAALVILTVIDFITRKYRQYRFNNKQK